MSGFMAPTQGLVMWNPTSTAQTLGLATDVVRDFEASASLISTTGSISAGSNTLTLIAPADFRNGQGIAVMGAGEAGDPLVTIIIGGGGSSYLTLAASAATSTPSGGATVQHDDSSAWQAAIDAATGPSIITCPPGSAMNLAATVQLRSQVLLAFPAATLHWIGPAGGTIFTSAVSTPLLGSGLSGGRIDPGAAGQVINLHSPQYCVFDLDVLDGSTTLTVMRWAADAENVGALNTCNATGNSVSRLVAGACGTLLDLVGQTSGAVTLNSFLYLAGGGCQVTGIACAASGYVDTNTFVQTSLSLAANNGIGVDLGQSDTAPNISNLVFVNLAIANASNGNCTGLYLRNASKVQVLSYNHTGFPPGAQINDGQSASYYIRDAGVSGAPGLQDTNSGWSVTPLQISPQGTPITGHISSLQTIGPVTVPTYSGIPTPANVSGVNQGDTVVATPNGAMPPGISWNAAALANGVVTLYLNNCTPVSIPMTPMHWRFDIWQH